MDGSPIIDHTPVEGLFLNAGWCYGGFKATPASGLCFAHLIATARRIRLLRPIGWTGSPPAISSMKRAPAPSPTSIDAPAGPRPCALIAPFAVRAMRRNHLPRRCHIAPAGRARSGCRSHVRLCLSARQSARPPSRALVSRGRLPCWLVVERDTLTHAIHGVTLAANRASAGMTGAANDGPAFPPAAGGRLDRSRTWRFTFNGKRYTGHPGDTLASALLAQGVRLVGRSFKYHRPRGILSAGSEEPNALVELRSGARREPNTRATMVELFDGWKPQARIAGPRSGLTSFRSIPCFLRFLPPVFTTRPSCGPPLSGSGSMNR